MMDFTLINPRQTVLVTSRGKAIVLGHEREKDDAIAIDWHMPASFTPFMYAISVGKKRFSYKLIKESGVFAVNFMPFELAKEVLFCGRHSGEYMDKIAEAGLKKQDASRIDCPVLPDSAGWLECKVLQEIDSGDHAIFIGEVISETNNSKGFKRVFHTGTDEFATIQ
jgi:flavin reductase (DIM6/NTAB) family NADH-FMN oxidoreductase RutF